MNVYSPEYNVHHLAAHTYAVVALARVCLTGVTRAVW